MTNLLTPGQYQFLTKDDTDDDAVTAIEAATAAVEGFIGRRLAFGTYTETLDVHQNGAVYPTAVPLATVSAPSAATIRGNAIIVGISDWPFITPWVGPNPPTKTVTYAGGYQPYLDKDGPTPGLPYRLASVIARAAYQSLHPVVLEGVPAGVRSVSTGDVSMSGSNLGGVPAVLTPDLCKELVGFVRRRVNNAWR